MDNVPPNNQAMRLRSELMHLANSLAGDKTGAVAVMLHQACNQILRAIEVLERDDQVEMDRISDQFLTDHINKLVDRTFSKF